MPYSADTRRRWIGTVFLTVAAAMLIAGQTVLKPHLQQQAFIYYWLVCFLFTGLTLIVALLDLRAIRRRSRNEQKDLIKNTLLDLTDNEENDRSSGQKNGSD
jgi:membrane protein implicated in regulation of membrane protease activity